MKPRSSPLILLAGLLASEPLLAQQGSVTILRGQSSETSGTPDTGVRRVPVDRNGTTPARPTPSQPGTGVTPLPVDKDGPSNGLMPPPADSDVAQAIASSKPLSPAEAAAFEPSPSGAGYRGR